MEDRRRQIRALEPLIHEAARPFGGHFTLALTDIATGEHIAIDEHEIMPTASVIKVFILGALYERIGRGEIALDDRVRFDEKHRTIGSGIMSYLDIGVEMSVRDAAVLMMIISDNSASNVCIELAGGVDAVNAWCRSSGFERTELFGPLGDGSRGLDGRKHYVTTAAESCRLVESIGRGQIVSPGACDDMLRIMRRSQKRDKLSRHLPWTPLNMLPQPRENWVAEKGGTYLDVRNDVALFHGPLGDVAVAAFTERGKQLEGEHEGVLLLGHVGRLTWDTLVTDGKLPDLRGITP